MGDRGWNTSESAAAEYDWPPADPPGRPRALMARARSGVSTPRMMETFAAAFSKTSPPSRTRVTPKPEPTPSRRHRIRARTSGAGGAIHALDVRAHGGLRVHDEALEVVELDAVRVDIEGE